MWLYSTSPKKKKKTVGKRPAFIINSRLTEKFFNSTCSLLRSHLSAFHLQSITICQLVFIPKHFQACTRICSISHQNMFKFTPEHVQAHTRTLPEETTALSVTTLAVSDCAYANIPHTHQKITLMHKLWTRKSKCLTDSHFPQINASFDMPHPPPRQRTFGYCQYTVSQS